MSEENLYCWLEHKFNFKNEITESNIKKYLNIQDENGDTPLMLAIFNKKKNYIDNILKLDPDIKKVNVFNETAFLLSCKLPNNLNSNISNILLKKGADAWQKNIYNETPLMKTTTKDNIELTEKIIVHYNVEQINQQDNIGMTALMLSRKPEIVSLLMKKGANAQLKNYKGHTAYDYYQQALEKSTSPEVKKEMAKNIKLIKIFNDYNKINSNIKNTSLKNTKKLL